MAVLLSWPPFMMPHSLYAIVYGWRYPKVWQCASAVLRDTGPEAASDRYRVDLGVISLDKTSQHSFHLCRLPKEQLWSGLEIELSDQKDWDTEWHDVQDVQVTLSISDSSGHLIARQSGRLAGDWTWSGPYQGVAFVYGRTAINSHPDASYEIHLDVSPGPSNRPRSARIVIKGGGWK